MKSNVIISIHVIVLVMINEWTRYWISVSSRSADVLSLFFLHFFSLCPHLFIWRFEKQNTVWFLSLRAQHFKHVHSSNVAYKVLAVLGTNMWEWTGACRKVTNKQIHYKKNKWWHKQKWFGQLSSRKPEPCFILDLSDVFIFNTCFLFLKHICLKLEVKQAY